MNRALIGLAMLALSVGCATTGSIPDRNAVAEAVARRTGVTVRGLPDAPGVPADVSLEDGVSPDEAVAVALWNNPGFHAALANLGLARADLVEARLLHNPILSLLFPVGPKQLEATLQFPVDALWQRPRRVAMAALNIRAVGERLVSDGLALVAEVRLAYVEAAAGERRVQLAGENADLAKQIADITEARLRAGDISELEARAPRTDAAQVEALRGAFEHDRDVASVTLAARMGVGGGAGRLKLSPGPPSFAAACGTVEAMVEEAMASRPDVRAAELSVEAAGRRLAWERSRIANFIAILDANGQGREGFEMGPGIGADLPVFVRNQDGLARANAEIERAARDYMAVRLQVATDVRAAAVRASQARQAMDIWGREIVPSLEIERRQAESAYKAGEISLLALLDVNRRLVQARMRLMDVELDLRRAGVTLDRSVGRSCSLY